MTGLARKRAVIIAASLSCALISILLTGCNDNRARDSATSGTPSSEAAASSSASQTGDVLSTRGVLTDGAERSGWRVDNSDGKRTVIIEQSVPEDESSFSRTLEFSSRAELQSFTEDRSGIVYPGDQSPKMIATSFVIDFSTSIPEARKTVDGAEVPVRDFEIANARRHAQLLWRETQRR